MSKEETERVWAVHKNNTSAHFHKHCVGLQLQVGEQTGPNADVYTVQPYAKVKRHCFLARVCKLVLMAAVLALRYWVTVCAHYSTVLRGQGCLPETTRVIQHKNSCCSCAPFAISPDVIPSA